MGSMANLDDFNPLDALNCIRADARSVATRTHMRIALTQQRRIGIDEVQHAVEVVRADRGEQGVEHAAVLVLAVDHCAVAATCERAPARRARRGEAPAAGPA